MRIRFLLPVYLQAHAALAVLHKPLHAVNSDIVPGKFIVEFEPKQEGTGYAHVSCSVARLTDRWLTLAGSAFWTLSLKAIRRDICHLRQGIYQFRGYTFLPL